MLRRTPILILLVMVGSCNITSHVNSNIRAEEEVQLNMLPTVSEKGLVPVAPLALALAPDLIDLAAGSLRTYFKDRAGEYVASWGATYVGEDFYTSDTSLYFAHRGFELKRFAGASSENNPAANLRFRYRINEEQTLFSVIPEYVELQRAKARLKNSDPEADLLVELSMNGWWKDKNGSIKSKQLGEATLLLRNIRLGETYRIKEEDGQFYLEDSIGNKNNHGLQTQWMIPVPVSVSTQGNRIENSRGNFTLTVNITEMDEAGERVERFANQLYDNRGLLKEVVDQVVD